MGVAEWFALFTWAIVCTGAGLGLLLATRLPATPLLHNWAGCWFAGQLVATVLVLSTGFLPWRLRGVLLVLVGTALVAFAVATLRRGLAPRAVLTGLGCTAALLLLFPHLLLVLQWTPPLEWDARSIWLFHGKALWHCHGVDIGFFGDPRYWWSNLDYPLHIPAQMALCAEVLGRWDDQAVRAFLWLDFLAYGRILLPHLRARGHDPLLAVAIAALWFWQGVPSYVAGELYVSGQADYHYAVPLALALLLWNMPAAERNWPLIGLLAARAAAVKNEGMLYVLGAAVLLAVQAGSRWWRSGERPRWSTWFAGHARELAFAVPLLVLPTLLWSLWKAQHGVSGGLHLVERATTAGVLWQALAERTGTVLEVMAQSLAHNRTTWLAIAWVVVTLAAGRPRRFTRPEAVVGVGLLGSLAVVFVTYVLTPHDVRFHMETSAFRLLFFPHLLVAVLVVFRIDALFAAVRQSSPRGAAPR